jgi:predicted 3-demethylubiquinone-9 3-methyltransferase (glyoxalase superfamily)
MQNITPFLWFDDNAEEAANYYVSLFKNSKIEQVSAMTVSFRLDGTDFVALNGGRRCPDGSALDPRFELSASSAVSFVVSCKDQAEVDRLWADLSNGGTPMQCGWIRDRFGVTWQIVPDGFVELISSDDKERSTRAMTAMMEMEKLDIDELRRVYYGEETTAK